MGWIKRSLAYSLIWIGFLIIWSLVSGWLISMRQYLPDYLNKYQPYEKLGKSVGYAFMLGIYSIWLYQYAKNRGRNIAEKSK